MTISMIVSRKKVSYSICEQDSDQPASPQSDQGLPFSYAYYEPCKTVSVKHQESFAQFSVRGGLKIRFYAT